MTIGVAWRKVTALLLGCLGFTCLGTVLVAQGNAIGWLAFVFAPGVPVALMQFIRPPYVRIGGRTVCVRQAVGRTRSYELERVGKVGIYFHAGAARGVLFDYDHEGPTPRWSTLTRRRWGASEFISDLYTVSPGELADELVRAQGTRLG